MEDHERLKSAVSTEEFKKLLKVPEEIEVDFDSLLKPFFTAGSSSVKTLDDTNEISSTTVNDSINIKLFRWLIQSLLYKEGPLVSKNGAALHLGVDINYFNKISDRFIAAKYSGIFCHSLEERWWVCALEDCILDEDDPDDLLSKLSFKEAAPMLLGATDSKDLSRCVSCQDRYPESLGIIRDYDDKELYQVHIACSEFDESLKQEPFFKNPRIIESD